MRRKMLYSLVIIAVMVGVVAGSLLGSHILAQTPPSNIPMTINYQRTLHGPQGRVNTVGSSTVAS